MVFWDYFKQWRTACTAPINDVTNPAISNQFNVNRPKQNHGSHQSFTVEVNVNACVQPVAHVECQAWCCKRRIVPAFSHTNAHTHTLLLWFTTSLVSILMGINWHNRYEASYKLQTRITLNLITFTAQKIYFPRTVTSHTRVSHKRTWSVCRVRIRGIANGVRFRFNDSWKSLASLSPSGGNASDIDVVILWIFCAKRTFNSILLLYMFDEWKITCTEIIFYSNVRHKIRDAATLLYPS